MPVRAADTFDFFLSRRGSVAAAAREVLDALTEKDHKVFVQDYDIPFAASFIEAIHEAVNNVRDLKIGRLFVIAAVLSMLFALTACSPDPRARHFRSTRAKRSAS